MQKVSFLSFRQKEEGISAALIKDLLDKGSRYGLKDIVPFSSDQIVVSDWVHMKCRYGCSQYGTNWCCPPAAPTAEEARSVLRNYCLALLVEGQVRCGGFYRRPSQKRSLQVRCWKGTVTLERLLFLEGYYKAFSLIGETCALCKECSYPEPCRFPQEKRPSVEAFSIDMVKTLANLGRQMKVATAVGQTFGYYGIILVE